MLFRSIEYKEFYDGTFIDMDIYKIGEYVLQYRDGSEAAIDIIYGGNISNRDVCWSREFSSTTDNYEYDRLLIEASSSTLPVKINDYTFYRFIAVNPVPEKEITGISVKTCKEGYSIQIGSICLI